MSLSTTFYRNLSIALLCLNLALIAFFFLMAPPHPKYGPMGKKATEILHFSAQQEKQFLEYANQHKQQMKAYNKEQRQLVEQYFTPLTTTNSTTPSDSLLTAIKQLEQQKIQSTYQHFQEIKAFLEEDQLDNFEDFVNNSLLRVLQGRKKRRHQ